MGGHYVDVIRITPNNAVLFEWIFVLISFFFVTLRFIVRLRHHQRINSSDYMILLALVCFIATVSCDTVMVRSGFSREKLSLFKRKGPNSAFVVLPHWLLERLMKMLYASSIPYYLSLWMVKITLVLLYYTLVPQCMPQYRYVLHFISAVVGISLVLVLVLNMFWCMPISENWNIHKKRACVAYFAMPPYEGSIVMHVVTEVLVFTFPLVLLLHILRFDKRIFRVAGMMFAVGFLGMLVSISRIVYIHLVKCTSVIGVYQAWASVEQAVGIIVCCLPAFRHIVVDLLGGEPGPEEKLSFIRRSRIGLMGKATGTVMTAETGMGTRLDSALAKEIAAGEDTWSYHLREETRSPRIYRDSDIERGYFDLSRNGSEVELPIRLPEVVRYS